MKLDFFFQQIFEKSSNIKCHANPSSGSRVTSRGQTDERTERHDKANNCFVRKRLKTGEEIEKNKRSFENFKYPDCWFK